MTDSSELTQLAAHIRMVALDVDGVLTDGTFLWDGIGGEYKRFSFADVMGISLGRRAGLHFAIISGEANAIIDRLAEKLCISDVYQGARDKAHCMRELIGKYKLSPAQVCYVGDDVNDIPVMEMVGFPVAVANANRRVFPHARLVTERSGGNGAVREVVDLILDAQESAKSAELSGLADRTGGGEAVA